MQLMPNVQKLVPGTMRGIGKHVTSAKRGKTCDRCQARNIKGGSPYQARKKRVTFGSWSEHIDEIFHLELNEFLHLELNKYHTRPNVSTLRCTPKRSIASTVNICIFYTTLSISVPRHLLSCLHFFCSACH